MATVSANDPRNGPAELRLKEQQETSPAGPGLAGRRQQSWASRFERGQGGNPLGGQSSAGLGTGWEVVSYLVSAIVAYGLIGWLIGWAVHIKLLFPVGMAVGLAIGLAWVIYRYGRVGTDRQQRP